MKIAHFSDLHYSNETLGEVDRCFMAAIDQACRVLGADVAVVSGDATDHRLDIHSPAVSTLASRIRILSDHCPVLMLQGTHLHEPPGTLDIFRLIGGKHPVFVADRFCQVALTSDNVWQSSTGWGFENPSAVPANTKAIFTCLPTVNKALVAAALGAENAAAAAGESIASLLRGYGLINSSLRSDLGVPLVGVSHGTVSGCETEHGVPMIGLDFEFTTGTLYSADCDAFLLGHVHKHQSWQRGGQAIAYAGSIGRLHYGEVDPKGCLLWNVDSGHTEFTFHETPARRMLHVEFAGPLDVEELKRIAADSDGAFVRIRWSVSEEDRNSIDRKAICALFPAAAEIKQEPRIVPITRSRAEGMIHLPSLSDKLKLWCEATDTPQDGLASRLGSILEASPEQIAAASLT